MFRHNANYPWLSANSVLKSIVCLSREVSLGVQQFVRNLIPVTSAVALAAIRLAALRSVAFACSYVAISNMQVAASC